MNPSLAVRSFAATLALASVGFGQGRGPAVSNRAAALVTAARSSDDAWQVVSTFVSARTRAVGQPRVDPADPDAFNQPDLHIQASLAASAFRLRFPGDARGGAARKLEAVHALQGVQLGAGYYRSTALSLGAAYRNDRSQTDRDRFDVGFLLEGLALAEALNGRRFIDDGVRYEQMADRLLAELGDTAEVYGLYVSIVRTTDLTTATRVANRLLGMARAPEWAKSDARTLLERSHLIGRPLNLTITTIGGDLIDLAAAHANRTVIYFWNPADGPVAFAALDRFRAALPTALRWVYVAVTGAPPVSDRPMAGSPFASTHCYDRAQTGGSIVRALKVTQAPYAFVLDRGGRVAGFGFPENLATLLEAANR
ncbi:MAG: hypothetical protein FJ399_03585 [Verrucomicrobia bacterium]|nr:hypothetical protein [Verrucomicrobiota bacterium]